MKPSECGEKKASRQCWECLKRRLVCDHTLPHCKKCQKAGKDCPGYDAQKPLQWIQPGKVTSRRRKKDSPPTIYTAPTSAGTKAIIKEPTQEPEPLSTSCTVAVPKALSFDPDPWVQFFPDSGLLLEDYWSSLASESQEKATQKQPVSYAPWAGDVEQMFAIGGRNRIEEVVEQGLEEQAVQMVGPDRNPLKRLERVLRLMQMNDLPNYTYLSNETNEIVQAVTYCTLSCLSWTFFCYMTKCVRQHTNPSDSRGMREASPKSCYHSVPA